MKLDKLAKRLGRDLAANPKKAAALGVMALVALYFWAPLVWGWLSQGERKGAGAGAAELILKDDPEEPAAQTKRRASKFRWEKVRQAIAQDGRMASAGFDSQWTDPFAGIAAPRTAAAAVPTASGAQALIAGADLDPAQAGLVLSSVMIGNQRRTATINGDTYREGSTIRIQGEAGRPGAVEFRLVRVTGRGVELERRGKTYVLLFAQPGLAKGDQIERTKQSD